MVFVDMTTAPPSLAVTVAEAVEARGAQFLVEPLARDARLDEAGHVLFMDCADAVEARQVHGHAAVERADMAFERGAGPKRHNRRAGLVTGADDGLHLLNRLGEHHGVRRVRRVEGRVLAVMPAHGLRGAEPRAEAFPEGGETHLTQIASTSTTIAGAARPATNSRVEAGGLSPKKAPRLSR